MGMAVIQCRTQLQADPLGYGAMVHTRDELTADIVIPLIGGGVFTIKPIIGHIGGTEPETAIAEQPRVTGKAIADALITAAVTQPAAQSFFGIFTDDIDHRHKGVGTISSRVRPTGDFNPLNIFQGNGNIIPVHLGDGGFVHRTAIHQNLHAPHKILC